MIEFFLSTEVCQSIFMAICHSLWQGLAISLILFTIDRFGLVTSARGKYLLCLTGLVILFLGFLTNLFFLSSSANFSGDPVATFTSFTTNELFSTKEPQTSIISWHFFVPILWLGGSVFFLLRSLIGLKILSHMKKKAVVAGTQLDGMVSTLSKQLSLKKEAKILLTDKLVSPLVYGVFNPVILFPIALINQLNPDQVKSILLHELIHIRQNDFLINLIQITIESFLYFNPFSWWLSFQIRKYREFHCDDIVIQKSSNEKQYIEALYKAAFYSKKMSRSAIPLFNQKKELSMRIKRILNHKNYESYVASWMRLFVILFVAVGLLSFSYLEGIKSNDKLSKHSAQLNLTKLKINNELPSLLELKQLERMPSPKDIITKKIKLPSYLLTDTVPKTNERIEELKRQIEEKSEQLEKISKEFEVEFEQNFEVDMQRMEEISERMEEKMEAYGRQFELDFENSESFRRLEELEEKLSEKLDTKLESIQVDFEDTKMEELEVKIEKLAEELEKSIDKDTGKIDPKKQKEFDQAMEEFSAQMSLHSSAISSLQTDIMDQPEMKALLDEIKQIQVEVESIQPDLMKIGETMMDDEMKILQEEINKMQLKLNEGMADFQNGKHKEMIELAQEIEMLSIELRNEHKKLEEQN